MTLLEKIPRLQKLFPVYAIVMLMVYAWTLRWFIWKFSSWVFYLRMDEILVILMYSLSVNFIESLLVLALFIVISMLLPRAWFHDHFVARGTALGLLSLGYLMYLASLFQNKGDFPRSFILRTSIPVFLAIVFIVYLSTRVGFVRKILEGIADRATIFLYMTVPVSIISIILVVLRNLF
jgi:hypothetical protein